MTNEKEKKSTVKECKLVLYKLLVVFHSMKITKIILLLLMAFSTLLLMLAAIHNLHNPVGYWFYCSVQFLFGFIIYYVVDKEYRRYYKK